MLLFIIKAGVVRLFFHWLVIVICRMYLSTDRYSIPRVSQSINKREKTAINSLSKFECSSIQCFQHMRMWAQPTTKQSNMISKAAQRNNNARRSIVHCPAMQFLPRKLVPKTRRQQRKQSEQFAYSYLRIVGSHFNFLNFFKTVTTSGTNKKKCHRQIISFLFF